MNFVIAVTYLEIWGHIIALIHKCDGAAQPEDLRPISIIGSGYEISAKNLASIVKEILPQNISFSHSAFYSVGRDWGACRK